MPTPLARRTHSLRAASALLCALAVLAPRAWAGEGKWTPQQVLEQGPAWLKAQGFVIDAKGRLVGVNFDRVWENVANDFGYNPDVARNVSVDVRYLLWILEEVEHAPALVAELTAAAK